MDAASILFLIFIIGIVTVAIWPTRQLQALVALRWWSVQKVEQDNDRRRRRHGVQNDTRSRSLHVTMFTFPSRVVCPIDNIGARYPVPPEGVLLFSAPH
jgi:hypothetical protein